MNQWNVIHVREVMSWVGKFQRKENRLHVALLCLFAHLSVYFVSLDRINIFCLEFYGSGMILIAKCNTNKSLWVEDVGGECQSKKTDYIDQRIWMFSSEKSKPSAVSTARQQNQNKLISKEWRKRSFGMISFRMKSLWCFSCRWWFFPSHVLLDDDVDRVQVDDWIHHWISICVCVSISWNEWEKSIFSFSDYDYDYGSDSDYV